MSLPASNPRKQPDEMKARAEHQDETTDSPIVRALARDVLQLLDENEQLRRSLSEHHNIRWLSEEAIKEGYGNPDGCQVCRRAHPREQTAAPNQGGPVRDPKPSPTDPKPEGDEDENKD
jgi:hypothetical protein